MLLAPPPLPPPEPTPSTPNPPSQIADMDREVDALYRAAFRGMTATLPPPPPAAAPPPPAGGRGAPPPPAAAPAAAEPAEPETLSFPDGLSEAEFGELGRARPEAMRALLEAKEAADAPGWRAFQAGVATAKLKRQRLVGRLAEAQGLLNAAERAAAKAGLAAAAAASEDDEADVAAAGSASPGGLLQQLLGRGTAGARGAGGAAPEGAARPVRIVLICGFESFNVGLYQQAARRLSRRAPHVTLEVRLRHVRWPLGRQSAGAMGTQPGVLQGGCRTAARPPFPLAAARCSPTAISPRTARASRRRSPARTRSSAPCCLTLTRCAGGGGAWGSGSARGWVAAGRGGGCMGGTREAGCGLRGVPRRLVPTPPPTASPPRSSGCASAWRASRWCSCLSRRWSSWAARGWAPSSWTPPVGGRGVGPGAGLAKGLRLRGWRARLGLPTHGQTRRSLRAGRPAQSCPSRPRPRAPRRQVQGPAAGS
jgi:hypothetical protein